MAAHAEDEVYRAMMQLMRDATMTLRAEGIPSLTENEKEELKYHVQQRFDQVSGHFNAEA